MQKSKIKQISLAVCLVLTPLSIYAAGLGKLNTQSGLGEPLKAEIEVFATPDELASLSAAIASETAYAEQGMTRLGIHNNIKVELSKNSVGAPILKLRSSQPIQDPYVDMLIQMDWASGRLQREYTVLLDPPTYKPTTVNDESVTVNSPTTGAVSDTSTTAEVSTSNSVVKSRTKKTKKQRKVVATPDTEAQVEASSDASGVVVDESVGGELTTKRGDTLMAIAKENQVEGVSLDQMLAGIYNSNKGAFVSGNMNRLKVGKIIKVPSKEELTAVSARKAKQIVKVHSSNWNAYRNTMANAVANAPENVAEEQGQSSAGKISTAEDKAAESKVGPQDVVKLSSGEKGTGKGFEDKVNALQEETAAREKSLKEAQDRAAALETQIKDMQKLLALKNQSMADKQQNATVVPAVSATTPEVKPEVNTTVPDTKVEVPPTTPPTEAKPMDASPTVTAGVSTTVPADAQPVQPEVTPPVEAKVEEKPAIEQKPVSPPPVVVPEEVEPSFLDGLMSGDNNLPLIGGGLGLGLLGAGWLFLRNRRKKNLDSFERGILTSGGLRANTVFGNTTSNTNASDTSFLTDFAQSVDGNMIDTNDVDPIAEAEVYMAYGRSAQAEEILKDAIVKEPKRYELHLKLLEIYVENKDNASFETIAGELYTTLGTDDPVWAKVAALGAKLEPDNPLYDLSKLPVAAVAAASALTDVDLTQDLDDNVLDFDDPTTAENNIDFLLDGEVSSENELNLDVEGKETPLTNFDNELEFDVAEPTSMDDSPVDETPFDKADDTGLMDFDLTDSVDLSDSTSVATADFEPVNQPDDLNSFDLPMQVDTATEVNLETPSILETPSNSLDFSMDFNLPEVATATADSITTEIEEKADFSFDLPEIVTDSISSVGSVTDEVVASASSIVSEPAANTFDLSSINLDLDAPTIQPKAEFDVSKLNDDMEISAVGAVVEPQDVEIKLDLVAVYIDMDDKIGARELLEEVLKEGGPQQKQRAQDLLASLA